MDNSDIRYYAPPEERMAYMGPGRPITNYNIIYPNSYVIVLIDGNTFQVYNFCSLLWWEIS